MVSGTYSVVDWMHVTAMPAIFHGGKSHQNKQHWCMQNVGMSRRNYHKHDPAPFPCTIGTQPRRVPFLTTKNAVQKKQETDSQMGLPCLEKPGYTSTQGGGGG